MLPSTSPATLQRSSFLTPFPSADRRCLLSPFPRRPLAVKIPPFRSEVPAGGKPPRRRRSYGSSFPKLGHQADVYAGAARLYHADFWSPGRWDHRRLVGWAGMRSSLGEEGSSVHCVRHQARTKLNLGPSCCFRRPSSEIAWPSPETPFEGAFVKGIDYVSWMANNSRKLLPSKSGGPHCWIFFSTVAFGKRNKVPQENISNSTAAKVTQSMLEGADLALGLPKGSIQEPAYTRLQLWGAALPTNTRGIPCIFDPQGQAGICGYWLLGSNLDVAALSGVAMANHVADYLESDTSQHNDFAVGLHSEFQPINGHGIEQFADMNFAKQGSEHEMSATCP